MSPDYRRRAADQAPSGPSLETYIETRFNLLTETLREQAKTQTDALQGVVEASQVAMLAIKSAVETSQVAADLRYQQRFEAQSDALAAAFLSQQTAMQTALKTAQEAVQAALAAADRAVSKAELAADKRFEALNELRQMLNDMVATLFPRIEAESRFKSITEKMDALSKGNADKIETNAKRLEAIDGRLNLLAGEKTGGQASRDQARAMVALGISLLIALLAVAGFILARLK
jgi:hypothetical protein